MLKANVLITCVAHGYTQNSDSKNSRTFLKTYKLVIKLDKKI